MFVSLLRVTAAIGAVPVIALLGLWLAGGAATAGVLLALAAVMAAAFGLALVWTRDLRALAASLQAAGEGWQQPGVVALPGAVTGEVERLSQRLGENVAKMERFARAEESIVERLPDPLLVLGSDRTVRRANEAARLAFGGEMAALLRHPELRSAIDRATATNKPQVAELRVPVPVPREVAATVVRLDSPIAGEGGALVVLSDRTRERMAERMRADFVANASHELRTPLASLTGFIETLRGPASDDPPAQRRFLEIMAEQASRMNRLIDDLLSLSHIELIEHQAPAEQVDLVAVVERMLAAFEIRFREKAVQLDWLPPDTAPEVAGDVDQLEQVVQNLVDNALKYGGEGGVVRVRIQDASGGKYPARPGVVLSVTDRGSGIPAQHLPRLTERFYRVDTGRSRAVGGTGLGLAIVKHVVNRHRGQLFIDSEEGRGATFSVWLPRA